MGDPEVLLEVYEVIRNRIEERPEGSYVADLTEGDDTKPAINKICEKIIEESGELILAAKDGDREGVVYESTDLIFHVLVLLAYLGIEIGEVFDEFERRRR
ncbi:MULTISPECIES: phosphoribosyl-ATP diphosphatase [unclassified Methanopyrus]|uniref:phosphoribosyl-ATP diphosphatase n=1 Tax=Methanopyrus sp. SNP6 TaxID=1937005 RepID=UPI0011E5DC6A|nr:phosphoribosyl-ATP diphosphatase [Methanopyrus sp. SNP6]